MVGTKDKSNPKGRAFQRKVAELYRLLGARVDEDIEICGKKVDLFVNILVPGSQTRHRIIVECKAEKTNRAQSQRVHEFSGVLKDARRADHADSAEIISLEPWSEQAKGHARRNGIELVTYEEKVRNLIDLTAYLSRLSESVHAAAGADKYEPALASYYVPLRGELRLPGGGSRRIDDLLAYLSTWSHQQKGHDSVALLGEYGSGKTSLCRMLAAQLAEQYRRDPDNRRIPILLNLREYTKSVGIEALVSSFLDQECGVANPRYRLFDAMHKAGLFLIILDGFDEMAARTDVDTLELNLSEIEKLTCPLSRLIVTTRPEYFTTQAEQESALRPSSDRTLLRARSANYEEIVISHWSDEQIEQFLKNRIRLLPGASQPWQYYRDKIHEIDDLRDLSRRPILAEMIVKTLPSLIESGEKIDRLNLYNTYLLSELQRQKIEQRRRLLHSDEKRLELLKEFAAEAYQDNASTITFSRTKDVIRQRLSPSDDDLTPLTRDFLSCSFLIRRHDDFVFSHRSIQEYLTAQAFLNDIKYADHVTMARSPLSRAVLSFMLERREEIIRSESVLLKWIQRTQYYSNVKEPYLGGNSATLICCTNPSGFTGKDFSKVSLRGAKLCAANLLDTNFTGATFHDVDLRKATVAGNFLQQVGRLQARVHLVVILARGSDKVSYLSELASQLMREFSPTVVRPEGIEIQEEHSRIEIHGVGVFKAGGASCGYFDAIVNGKETFDQAIKYLLDLPAVKDAWFYEVVEQRSAPSRAKISHKLPEVVAGTFFDRLTIRQ